MTDELRRLVTVKPLEWTGTAEGCFLQAESLIGTYEVSVEYSDEWYCDFTDARSGKSVRLAGCQDGPLVPQAMASAHHESRIFAALTHTKDPNP